MIYKPSLSDDNIRRVKDTPDEIINYVVDEFSKSEKTLEGWKKKIVTYYELYQLVQKKKHYEGLANIFVPEILRAVETIVAHMYQSIFSSPDWFEYSSRTDPFQQGSALAMTKLVAYQMDENSFKSKVMDSLRQMVIAGLTVRKVLWDYQEVSRKITKKGQVGLEKALQTDTIKDTWTVEPIDLLAFHISDIDVPYNDLQKARWIGEQTVATKTYVTERSAKGWFSRQMWSKLEEDPKATESQASRNVESRLNSSGFTNLQKDGKIELLEMWGLVPVEWVMSDEQMKTEGYEKGDKVEGVIVVGNRRAILKLELNPFYHQQKPYVACPYIPKEFELPGMGAAQIGQSLQEEINDTRNQTMDNKTLILATMWLKSKTSGIKNQDLQVRPNGVIVTNDMNGLQPLRPPVVTGVGTNMEGVSKNDLRESVGASSNLQGIAQSGVGTATESALINKQSVGRLEMTTTLYSELVLKPILVFAEFLNYQFYNHIKVIKIIGKTGIKFEKLTPDEIAGGHKDVIIKISTDSTENPAVMRQQFMTFFTQVVQMPPAAMAYHWKSLDRLYGLFFSGHSLDELYPNPQIDEASLPTPQEERDMVLGEQPVVAANGQDHKQFIKYHEQEYDQMKMALNDVQTSLYHKLILSHYELLQKEIEQQTQQLAAQQAMFTMQGPNKGSTPNTTPFNATPAPSVEGLRKGIGG